MIKPMLLHECPVYMQMINVSSTIYIQPKLNGWRAVINTRTGLIYARSGKQIDLPHITQAILSMHNLPEWLDGELYIHGRILGHIQSMIKNKNTRVQFHCFDCIIPGNYSQRVKVVNSIIANEIIKIVPTQKITPSQITEKYNEFLAGKFEGAVIRLDKEYEQKRSEHIFKMKPKY